MQLMIINGLTLHDWEDYEYLTELTQQTLIAEDDIAIPSMV